jgi:hypothetical protein
MGTVGNESLLRLARPFGLPALAWHRRIKGVALIRLTDCRPLRLPYRKCSRQARLPADEKYDVVKSKEQGD